MLQVWVIINLYLKSPITWCSFSICIRRYSCTQIHNFCFICDIMRARRTAHQRNKDYCHTLHFMCMYPRLDPRTYWRETSKYRGSPSVIRDSNMTSSLHHQPQPQRHYRLLVLSHAAKVEVYTRKSTARVLQARLNQQPNSTTIILSEHIPRRQVVYIFGPTSSSVNVPGNTRPLAG